MELVLSFYAAFPPCVDEAAAVTEKLDERRRDAQKAYLEALVGGGGVGGDKQAVKQYGQPRCGAQPVPAVYVVILHKDAPYGRC